MKTAFLAKGFSRSGLRAGLKRTLRWSGVLVLNYHRIGDPGHSNFDRALWSADADAFETQVRFCKSELDIVTPDDLPEAVRSARGRYALITFDDGYRDNYAIAYPILRALGVPATFFVVTGFLDAPQVAWWDEIAWMVRVSTQNRIHLSRWEPAPLLLDQSDRETAVRTLLRVFKRIPTSETAAFLDAVAEATGSGRCGSPAAERLWMNWEMLREMRRGGMTIGGHTVTHPILACTSPDQQRDEIAVCARRLAEETGEAMKYFSYPVGGPRAFGAVTRDCLRQANVAYAFTNYGGMNRFTEWDNYNVRRVSVETDLTPDWFESIVTLPNIFG